MTYKPLIVAAVAAAAVGAGTASASPVANGCPAAFDARPVSSFGEPYRLPPLVDGSGNGNGTVCAFPLPDAVRDAGCRAGGVIDCELQQLGLPVYRFVDDVIPEAAR